LIGRLRKLLIIWGYGYKKANGVNLSFLVVVIVALIVGAAVVSRGFCYSGNFVITNVISNLPEIL
jgi:hypothetical protein